MHQSSKSKHCDHISHYRRETNYHGKLMKKHKVSEKQHHSAEECCYTPWGNAHRHFSKCLPHLIEPALGSAVHVVCTKMKNIVYWEPNQHDNRYGLILAKLLAVPLHEGDDADDDYRDTPDGENTRDQVLGDEEWNYESEANRDDDALVSTFHESLLDRDGHPSTGSLDDAFHFGRSDVV